MSLNFKIGTTLILSLFSYMILVFIFNMNEKLIFLAQSDLYISLVSSFLIISFISYLCISLILKKEFIKFEYKINDYLEYINQNKYTCDEFDIQENSEFSEIFKKINLSIKKKKKDRELEYEVLKEAIDVEKNLAYGDLSLIINSVSNNESLNNLKDITNLMILKYENNISKILEVLEEFVMGNYLKRLEENENSLHLNKLNVGINELADTITNMLIKNKTNALTMQDESESFFRQMNFINKTCKESKISFQNAGFELNKITASIIKTNEESVSLYSKANELSFSINKNEILLQESLLNFDKLRVKINEVSNYMNKMDELVFNTNLLVNNLRNNNLENNTKELIENFQYEAKTQVEEIISMKYLIKDCIDISDEYLFTTNMISLNFKNLQKNMFFSKKSISLFIKDKNEENRIIKKIKAISSVLNAQLIISTKTAVKIRNVMFEKDTLLSNIISETNENSFLGKFTQRKQHLIESNNFKDLNKIFNVDEFKSRRRKKTVFI